MGRCISYNTEIIANARKLSLSVLIKAGLLKEGQNLKTAIAWKRQGQKVGEIEVSSFMQDCHYLELVYTHTDALGTVTKLSYPIELDRVPSNLGKGYKYYFVCPVTFRRCEHLYLIDGYKVFQAKEAFRNRLYYPLQLEPKKWRWIKSIEIEHKLIELIRLKRKSIYKGKPTRLQQRIDKLEKKLNFQQSIEPENLF